MARSILAGANGGASLRGSFFNLNTSEVLDMIAHHMSDEECETFMNQVYLPDDAGINDKDSSEDNEEFNGFKTLLYLGSIGSKTP